jgi:hypothetical protein
MIRYLFVFVMLIHGLIHLAGFAAAFGFSRIDPISSEITRPVGALSLIATISLTLTTVFFLLRNKNWLWAAILSILVSQTVILMAWQDARFGTILNIIIVLGLLTDILTKEINVIFRD